MLLVSERATMNLRWLRSSATGNMRLRRAMSRGSAFSAAGSTMMRARSTDCSPSFSDSASRSVASETKPSCTSSLPTGMCCLVCSSSAMRSWSSVRMPWSIRIWPRWRFACGGTGWFIRSRVRLAGELRGARLCPGDIKAGAAYLGKGDGALVILERELRLAQLVQAHREVIGEVGVVRLGAVRPEVFLLRFGPSPLLRELVTEGEIEHVRARVVGQHRFHPALRGQRIGAPGAQRDERCQCVGIA